MLFAPQLSMTWRIGVFGKGIDFLLDSKLLADR